MALEVPGFNPPVLGVLLAASAILLAQGIVDCVNECQDTVIWAIVCGGFSVLLCTTGLFTDKPIMRGLCLLLFAWWMAGVGVLTFDSPYAHGSGRANGYVASWIGFIAASILVSQIYGSLYGIRPVLLGLIIASVVEFVSALVNCNDYGACSDYHAFAVAAGGVGVVAGVIASLLSPRRPIDLRAASWFLFVWWAASWTILTFKGPFTGTGNGFFSAWAAAILASALLAHSEVVAVPDAFVDA